MSQTVTAEARERLTEALGASAGLREGSGAQKNSARTQRAQLDAGVLSERPSSSVRAYPTVAEGETFVTSYDQDASWRSRRVEFLDARLAAEPVDRAWAGGIERSIWDRAASFNGSTLRSVRCASTICAFEAEHDDEAARMRFEVELVQSTGAALQHAFSQWYDDGAGPRTVLFMARTGYLLPRLEGRQ